MKQSYPMFEAFAATHGLPTPVREYRFAPPRRWRFDFAWLDVGVMVALEIDGGVWTGGRHGRGKGFIADQEKLNEAAILGWKVIRCVPADVKSGAVFATLRRAIIGKGMG